MKDQEKPSGFVEIGQEVAVNVNKVQPDNNPQGYYTTGELGYYWVGDISVGIRTDTPSNGSSVVVIKNTGVGRPVIGINILRRIEILDCPWARWELVREEEEK